MNAVEDLVKDAEDKMKKTISEVNKEMAKIRTGRANPLLLEAIHVEYYGTNTALNQLANISNTDGQTLVINPYDKNVLGDIEKAILKSDLDLTPNNDGSVIRLTFPALTTDRRKEMVKSIKKIGEDKKVIIRNVRRDAGDHIKKVAKAESISEDDVRKKQDTLQKITDKYIKDVDDIVHKKETDILEI